MHRANNATVIAMLQEKGVDYLSYPEVYRYGALVKRRQVLKTGLDPLQNVRVEVPRSQLVWSPMRAFLAPTDAHIKLLQEKYVPPEHTAPFRPVYPAEQEPD
jgi:hypothetical protein